MKKEGEMQQTDKEGRENLKKELILVNTKKRKKKEKKERKRLR